MQDCLEVVLLPETKDATSLVIQNDTDLACQASAFFSSQGSGCYRPLAFRLPLPPGPEPSSHKSIPTVPTLCGIARVFAHARMHCAWIARLARHALLVVLCRVQQDSCDPNVAHRTSTLGGIGVAKDVASADIETGRIRSLARMACMARMRMPIRMQRCAALLPSSSRSSVISWPTCRWFEGCGSSLRLQLLHARRPHL